MTDFYIDANRGAPGNNGLTKDTAWKSLADIYTKLLTGTVAAGVSIGAGVLDFNGVEFLDPPSVGGFEYIAPEPGATITCTPGEWSSNPGATITRNWLRDGQVILGETGITYTILPEDVGHNA